MKYKLSICHLYPDLLDTYGDKGNILALKYRCGQRGIKFSYHTLTINEPLNDEYDMYFIGGGQDQAQNIVGRDLQRKSEALKKSILNGAVLLSICGGYQLMQNYFKTASNNRIPGIGLFNAYTEASETRMMNNLLIELNPSITSKLMGTSHNLIGFENHSGKTYLKKGTEPLGTVIAGSGNNGVDHTEGAIYKNAFGCYLHGSLLPKNPYFSDYLTKKALERKYGNVDLKPLDDTVEWQAHKAAIAQTR